MNMHKGNASALSGEAGINPRRPLFFLALASFSAAAANRIMDAILPGVASEFGASVGTVALIATVYAFAYGGCQLLFGPLGDRLGKYRVLVAACAASAIATFLCALAWSLAGLASGRLVAGIAAASIVPLAIAWVGDNVPDEARQQVLARFMSGQILGLLAGQTGGGIIGELLGWRMAFVLIGSAYVLALLGLLSEAWRDRRLLAPPADHTRQASLHIFRQLLLRPQVRFVLAVVAIEAFAMFGAMTFIGASLHQRYGFGLAAAGGYLALYCMGGVGFVLVSGPLIKRYGSMGMAARGSVLAGLAYVVMALTPVHQLYLPAIALLGLGFYMLHNTLQTMATQMAPDARGAAVGLFAAVYFLAQAMGVWLASRIIDTHGATPVFIAAGGILIALACFLLRYAPAAASEAPSAVRP